jgi:LmbE family N-acetylglucosaminyl deacetylase
VELAAMSFPAISAMGTHAITGDSGARVIVLSPHLDDAVLSLGAAMAQLRKAGREVEVWTFFTRAPTSERIRSDRRVFVDYQTRCAEDEGALSHIGAKLRWLGFEERLFRDPALPRVSDVFRTPRDADDFTQLTKLCEAIDQALVVRRQLIVAPLGVGNHHDHVELALAAMRVMCARRAFDRFAFYEDFYALGTALRRRHFVTRGKPWPAGRNPTWCSPLLALSLRVSALLARGPGVDGYLPEVAELDWQATVVPGEMQVKLRALAEYRSQVAAFGGLRRIRAFLQGGYAAFGGEVVWRGVPSAGHAKRSGSLPLPSANGESVGAVW